LELIVAENEPTNVESPELEGEGTQANAQPKGGGLKKIIIMGGGGLLVVALSVAGALFFMGSGDRQAVEAESPTTVDEHRESDPAAHEPAVEAYGDDSHEETAELSIEDDPSLLEDIQSQLEFLDYEPDMSELPEDPSEVATQDSIDEVYWLEEEKAVLADREMALNARADALAQLDHEVSKKVLVLEQAESSRIAKLAKLYDGMDARSVAALMANLDDDTVVMILPRMNIKNASSVLSLLPPMRAAKLSKQMITIAGN
jgi:flagellar motility protein MotE (MotC chaperone)